MPSSTLTKAQPIEMRSSTKAAHIGSLEGAVAPEEDHGIGLLGPCAFQDLVPRFPGTLRGAPDAFLDEARGHVPDARLRAFDRLRCESTFWSSLETRGHGRRSHHRGLDLVIIRPGRNSWEAHCERAKLPEAERYTGPYS